VTSTLIYVQAFYLPWAMLALDVIFGSKILPDLLGIIAGHLYYFLTVLHPLAGGKIMLKTPMWVYPYIFGLFTASSIYCNIENVLAYCPQFEALIRDISISPPSPFYNDSGKTLVTFVLNHL